VNRNSTLACIFVTISPAIAQQTLARGQAQIAGAYGRLPMSFEPDSDLTDSHENYLARGSGYALLLTPIGGTLSLNAAGKTSASKMTVKLIGGNPGAKAEGLEALPGRSNYLIGNDPSKWRINVANYAKVKYREVYPGVDMVYYGNQQQLEYDMVVAPGANPHAIKLGFSGVQTMRIAMDGDLVLGVAGGEVRQHKPVVYQEVAGLRQAVEGRYVRRGGRRIGFELGKYDVNRPLVIDPRLTYSTYLGGPALAGGAQESGLAIAADSSGNAYVTGWTAAIDFPVKGAIQPVKGAGQNVFVTKLNASGTALVYSTYLGGSNSSDEGRGIAVDSSGNAFVVGRTSSATFPVVLQLPIFR
jgi:hypothetical protein